MTGRDLYNGMTHINIRFVAEAEALPQSKPLSLPRPVLIAAVLTILLLCVSCGTVLSIIDAEEPWISIPQVEGADVVREDIQITITGVTPGGLTFSCDLAGFGEAEKSVVLHTEPPCTIQRKTHSGWETLPQKVTDPQWNAEAVLTDGHHDGRIRWAAHYGFLDVGTYRVTAQLIDGHEDFTLEFDITEDMRTNGLEIADTLFSKNFWHIRHIPESSSYFVEYWKCGNDYLVLTYDGDEPILGMMLKDGMKYKLAREQESNDTPIIGWTPWPDMDLNRLTEWVQLFENRQLRLETTPGKNDVTEIWKLWISGSNNRIDEGVTFLGTLVILDTSAEEISQKIHKQDTDYMQEIS